VREREAFGGVAPVPLRDTVWVTPLKLPLLSVKVSVPVSGPAEPGAKLTFSVQLLPGASGETATQFPAAVKLVVTATVPTNKGAPPVLVTVTVCGLLLVVPTTWLPKLRLMGEREAVAGVRPVPLRETD
jgi:hypothetical protein